MEDHVTARHQVRAWRCGAGRGKEGQGEGSVGQALWNAPLGRLGSAGQLGSGDGGTSLPPVSLVDTATDCSQSAIVSDDKRMSRRRRDLAALLLLLLLPLPHGFSEVERGSEGEMRGKGGEGGSAGVRW